MYNSRSLNIWDIVNGATVITVPVTIFGKGEQLIEQQELFTESFGTLISLHM